MKDTAIKIYTQNTRDIEVFLTLQVWISTRIDISDNMNNLHILSHREREDAVRRIKDSMKVL